MTFAEMDAVVDWMREHGVTHFATPAITLTLGHAPPPPAIKADPLSPDQIAKLVERHKRDQEALLFASSEGFPDLPEEE